MLHGLSVKRKKDFQVWDLTRDCPNTQIIQEEPLKMFFSGLFEEMGVYLKSAGVYLMYRTPPKRFTYCAVICYFRSLRPHFPVRIEGTCLFSSTCYYQICCRCAGERGRRLWWQCKLRWVTRHLAWPDTGYIGDFMIRHHDLKVSTYMCCVLVL